MHYKIKFTFSNTFYFFLILVTTPLFSQSPPTATGSWLIGNNQTRLNSKWSIHAEAQYRSFEITPNTDQMLLRGGINYHVSNNAVVTAGYAFVANYAFDKEQLPGIQALENRIWQQFLLRNSLGRFNFEHRYRLEQRWIESNNTSQYLDRARYMLRITVPLNKKEMGKNTLFLSLYDEVFIHLSPTPFDRNRLYGAIGFQFLSSATIQLGYLAQTTNAVTKHYLQTAIAYPIDFRKKD